MVRLTEADRLHLARDLVHRGGLDRDSRLVQGLLADAYRAIDRAWQVNGGPIWRGRPRPWHRIANAAADGALLNGAILGALLGASHEPSEGAVVRAMGVVAALALGICIWRAAKWSTGPLS